MIDTDDFRADVEERVGRIEVNGQPVSSYRPGLVCGGEHGPAMLVGYVVRLTISADGTTLWRDAERTRCGYDVNAVPDADNYVRALDFSEVLRAVGGYSLIDRLYRCGCRS